jgi:chorismate mutase/prephenate dehydrogenase
MQTQKFQVHVVDPQAPAELDRDGRRALPSADWIVCAAPPRATVDFYRALLESPPSGLVCDIASIKSPLVEPIAALRRAGVSVGSFHPMFGPATVVLRGEDVVVCDTGDEEARAAIERLFGPTLARLVFVDLEKHDRLMAEVLALAHATTMAFSGAQSQVEIPPVHSTTYRVLEDLAGTLAEESPDVYFEIQADNPHAEGAVERLERAVHRILEVVRARDRVGFGDLMGRPSG